MKRSKFSLSNYKLFSCNMGNLIPCGLLEVLPGDTIQQSTSALIRCSPLLTPVMHPVHVRIHHWFVPHRLLWEDWESFITGGEDGMDNSEFPTIEFSSMPTGSLGDYLGIPNITVPTKVSALPFRAYNLIWNEWYRDQDLQTPKDISTESGPDTVTETDLLRCAWEKDYFTSARPWEQKGPAVTIPLGTTAPVTGIGKTSRSFIGTGGNFWETGDTAAPTFYQNYTPIDNATANFQFGVRGTAATNGSPDIQADLSQASAITINLLREAFSLQRFEEARARYGSRYVEYLRYLGVRSSDARLQRPEYLGGGKQTIQFSEVLQTAEGESPVGEMRGHGIGAMRSNRYRRFIEEHGYIITMMSVRPKTMYMEGLARTWNRRNKEDFWQKEFQHIGQQEILNKELFLVHTNPEGTFGYQDRYDEYRRQESTVAGEFRTSLLNDWHFARSFGSNPALNADFVECVPTERTFADTTSDVLRVMANHSIQARRLVAPVGSSFIF
nr:MAG: major capsid protein [Microvirus sp.]